MTKWNAPSFTASTADVDVGDRRGHDHLGGRVVLAQDAQQLETRDAGLAHVDERDVDLVAREQREGAFRARGAQDAEVLPQRVVQRLARSLVLIDDEQGLLTRGHVSPNEWVECSAPRAPCRLARRR